MRTIHYRSVEIDRLKIFYRERPPKARHARTVSDARIPDRGPHVGDLIPLLSEKCHIVAPVLPGGGGAVEEQPPCKFNSLAGKIGSILIHNYKIAITSKYRISNQPAFPVAREAQ